MTTTPRLGITQLEEDQALPEAVVNEAVLFLEMTATRLIVLSKGDNAPAGGEDDGEAYLVGPAGTGAFSGHDDELAMLINGAWEFRTAPDGFQIEVLDEDTSYTLRGGTWESDAGAAIEVLDEGVSETASLVSLDFVGAGVSANDDGSGNVTVTISGVAAGTTYDGGPPTPATTADLTTWVNQGTSSVSDGTGALILRPQVDGFVHGREKTAPSAPYDIYMKVNLNLLSSAAATTAIVAAAGIMLRDNSDGEILTWAIYYERIAGDEQNTYGAIVQRWTNPTTFSATPLLRFNAQPWPWLRVNVTSTTVTFYASPDGKNWIQAGTETISTFIDTIDRIGVVGIASANATEAVVTVPYFSTTAPS